jgi:hypothetical protein
VCWFQIKVSIALEDEIEAIHGHTLKLLGQQKVNSLGKLAISAIAGT